LSVALRGFLVGALALGVLAGTARAYHVNVATISGSINPYSSDYLQRAIEQSEREGAAALVIRLDTPGGLLASTKDVIQAILNAGVPVIVWVAPSGAWAGSAGTFITIAGHVAARAPGTTSGAAAPIGIGTPGAPPAEPPADGMAPAPAPEKDAAAKKAENITAAFIESIARERKRNVEWAVKAVREAVAIAQDEAVKIGVVDFVAKDLRDLLQQSEGREVSVRGAPKPLAVAHAETRELEMSWVTRFFDVLASPDIAVLLILAGLLGLYVELTQPGVIVPGIVGAACLLLGFASLQILPFSWLGLGLLLGGIALLVAEVYVTSFGALFAAGVVCFLLGGTMLFDRTDLGGLDVSFWGVLVPAVAAVAVFGGVVVLGIARSLRRPGLAGTEEMVGLVGRAASSLAPEGTVFVRGEYWTATAEGSVAEGERVVVVGVDGLRLRVRAAGAAA
jgi:membrane-bound serine protease (ClpP class)